MSALRAVLRVDRGVGRALRARHRGQTGVASFFAFASNREYLAGVGHRLAALEDSRLLPLVEERAPVR